MAARTVNDIINIAFDILGEAPVADIATERGEIAERANSRYQGIFDFVFKMARWPDCRKVIKVTSSETNADDPDFSFAAQLPNDCLKVWSLNGSRAGWKRQRAGKQGKGMILTNCVAPYTIVYAARVAPDAMSEELAELCAAKLANDLKYHAALSGGRRKEVEERYRVAVRDASVISGADDGTDQPLPSNWHGAMDGI